jgi:hypothetical protein
MTVRTISSLPELPVVSLQTAESKNTVDAFRGKNTVIGTFLHIDTLCGIRLHPSLIAQN